MEMTTKRTELLAYGARGEREAAKTAAELVCAVKAGRAHNRLVGYAAQPYADDLLEPRHVKGALALMLKAGQKPVAAALHLGFHDGEPRYTVLGAPFPLDHVHASS